MSMGKKYTPRLPSVVNSRLSLSLALHRRPILILDRAACFDHDPKRVQRNFEKNV